MTTFGASGPAEGALRALRLHPGEHRRARRRPSEGRQVMMIRQGDTAMSVSTEVNPRLAALTAAGTSVWLDQIRRSLIESGELQRLIDESTRCAASPPTRRSSRRRSSAPTTTTPSSRAWPRRGSTPRRSTTASRSRTCSSPPTCCGRCGSELDDADGFVSLEVDARAGARHRRHARAGARATGRASTGPT